MVNLELEPGRHTIAIGVRDEINRRSSFHRATVSLGGAETGASGPPAGSSR